MKNYQLDYATGRPQMYDETSRKLKALNIVKILTDFVGLKKLKSLNVLDVGASSGIIDSNIAPFVKELVGIDIDILAIKHANKNFNAKNLIFRKGDALNLKFKSNSFDIIICTHVYEHVEDPDRLFKEIYRVLKPDGICYLAAVNALWPIEPHYYLPFLSYLPKPIANIYIGLFTNKKYYYETLFTYWGLMSMVTKLNFKINDYTPKILSNPKKFEFSHKKINPYIANLLKYFTPTFFWILKK
ncbi:MAG: class I SAM-dependent methyltransferase [Patescibacteria group bacterium]